MKKKSRNKEEVIDTSKLIRTAADQLTNEEISLENSEVTENGKTKIVILRNAEKDIIALMQWLGESKFINLNN